MPPERLAHPYRRHRSVALHTQIWWVPDKNLTRIPVVTPHHGDSAYAVFAGNDNYGQGQTHCPTSIPQLYAGIY